MPKGRRAVRLIFNTYYENDARNILDALQRSGIKFSVSRSKVVNELYYVDIDAGNQDLESVLEKVRSVVEKNRGQTIFGVKIYAVDASK